MRSRSFSFGLLALSVLALLGAPARACLECTCLDQCGGTQLTYLGTDLSLDGGGTCEVFEVRATGYETFGSHPGHYCACGLSTGGGLIKDVVYVDVVLAGTDVPVGFAFEPNANTGSGFSSLGPGEWQGFLAESPDVAAGTPVDLIFWVTAPLGTTSAQVTAELLAGAVGTDEGASDGTLTGNNQGVFGIEDVLPMSFDYTGCDMNPPGSLTLSDETPSVIGNTVTFALDNPLGTQTPGATQAFLFYSFEPLVPCGCGPLIPTWGMAPGAAGELLFKPTALAPIAGPVWQGPGLPAEIPLPIPDNPAFVNVEVWLQGLLADAVTVDLGLTEGMRMTVLAE